MTNKELREENERLKKAQHGRCGTCGACKECGASPAPAPVYIPVYVQPTPVPFIQPIPAYPTGPVWSDFRITSGTAAIFGGTNEERTHFVAS